jgi:citrate lyase beta subunit
MPTLLEDAADLLERLRGPYAEHAGRFPGERAEHQPIHTLYWGAHRFGADTVASIGAQARLAFERWADDPFEWARLLGFSGRECLPTTARGDPSVERYACDPDGLRNEDFPAWLALAVHDRVRARLEAQPVEDLRIDFEDGYGRRPQAEEDGHAEATARAVARATEAGTMAPRYGIRIKPLTNDLAPRAIATLDRFVSTLVSELGRVPAQLVVTLPKVTIPEQIQTMVALLERLETRLGLPSESLHFELMVEVVQCLFDAQGRFNLPRLLDAAGRRLRGVHLGVYDYTASAGITAAWQAPDHPVCDLARGLMRLGYGNTGVFLSDGSTNVLPVPPHDEDATRPAEERANRAAVHRAWKLAHDHIRHALVSGFVQGWDLHPAQLPIRYAATYAFFLESFDAAADRLRSFLASAQAATDDADVLDDVATGQALLNFVSRAHAAGAVTPHELRRTGLSAEELRTRSFADILAARAASRLNRSDA